MFAKGYNNSTNPIDRTFKFQQMRRSFSKNTPMSCDVDLIEWTKTPQGLKAAGVFELTSWIRDGVYINQDEPLRGYFRKILQRYEGFQAQIARTVADALNTTAYLIMYRDDCEVLWLYNLSQGGEWTKMSPEDYEGFLFQIKNDCLDKYAAAS